MAGSVNKVILVGNLGRDPDVRSFQSGDKVCNLAVATSESWKDKASGERKEKTQWHNVVIYNQALVDIASRYLKKGSKVYLEGQLESRKYNDKDGVEKYITEVALRQYRGELTLLDGNNRGDSEGGGYSRNRDSHDSGGGYNSPSSGGGSYGGASRNDLDDDIPF